MTDLLAFGTQLAAYTEIQSVNEEGKLFEAHLQAVGGTEAVLADPKLYQQFVGERDGRLRCVPSVIGVDRYQQLLRHQHSLILSSFSERAKGDKALQLGMMAKMDQKLDNIGADVKALPDAMKAVFQELLAAKTEAEKPGPHHMIGNVSLKKLWADKFMVCFFPASKFIKHNLVVCA